jgi:hypothetical protein
MVATMRLSAQSPDTIMSGIFKVNVIAPGVSYERHTVNFQSIYAEWYMATSFGVSFSSSQGTNAFLTIDPAVNLQYRFYYNARRRSVKGKRIALNSLNYIAPTIHYILTKESVSDEFVTEPERRPVLLQGVLWGMQRNYPKRFSINLSAGPGFYFARSTTRRIDNLREDKSTTGLTLLARIRLGWWLNKRSGVL